MALKASLKKLKALSDLTRLRMFLILSEVEEVCSCDFAELFGFSAPTISRHTSILCEAELISCRKDGRWVFFSLNKKSSEAELFLQVLRKSVKRSEIEKDIAAIGRCNSGNKSYCCKTSIRKVKSND